MPKFSKYSLANLETAHQDLQCLFHQVIRDFDIRVLEGHRSVEEQQYLYASGRTRPGKIVTQIDGVTKKSSHNYEPALAVDVVPYPVDWNDRERFYLMAGYVLATASSLGIAVRWGGDWDSDHDLHDQTFFDLPHFELL